MENITWHKTKVTAAQRQRVMGQRPMVIWLTGLSGSGKSSVGAALEQLLTDRGYKAYLLDGDNLRFGLNAGLGFSEADRAENIRRITEAARLLADSGMIAIVSAISPSDAVRKAARGRIAEVADFVLCYVDTPLEECARRDVKGLYKKAFAGEIADFTGVSAPYEEPQDAELHFCYSPARSAIDDAESILSYIEARQLDCERALRVMKEAALLAGERIMEIYGRDFSVELKEDRSPLTEADLASNTVISELLTREFPGVSLLTEESADDESRLYNRWCFVVDPLDGTKEFVKRNGEFTVNIALCFDHRSVMGVIYVPAGGELYYAAEGMGAYREKNGQRVRLHVSDRTEGLVVMESRSHGDNRLDRMLEANAGRIARTVSAGSSLKGCRIAEGEADVYYRFGPTMEWDTAAMQILCEEAGAVFAMLDGYDSPMTYNRTHTRNDQGFYILNHPASALAPAENGKE